MHNIQLDFLKIIMHRKISTATNDINVIKILTNSMLKSKEEIQLSLGKADHTPVSES